MSHDEDQDAAYGALAALISFLVILAVVAGLALVMGVAV